MEETSEEKATREYLESMHFAIGKVSEHQWRMILAIVQGRINDCISLALAQRDEEARKNVGMLRQWLNEDRITLPENMVSDEEILSWFAPTSLNRNNKE